MELQRLELRARNSALSVELPGSSSTLDSFVNAPPPSSLLISPYLSFGGEGQIVCRCRRLIQKVCCDGLQASTRGRQTSGSGGGGAFVDRSDWSAGERSSAEAERTKLRNSLQAGKKKKPRKWEVDGLMNSVGCCINEILVSSRILSIRNFWAAMPARLPIQFWTQALQSAGRSLGRSVSRSVDDNLVTDPSGLCRCADETSTDIGPVLTSSVSQSVSECALHADAADR